MKLLVTGSLSLFQFLQINIGVVKLRDSGSMGSSKCVVYDNLYDNGRQHVDKM